MRNNADQALAATGLAVGTVTAMTPWTRNSPDRPDDATHRSTRRDASPSARVQPMTPKPQPPRTAEPVRQVQDDQPQRPLSWPRVLLVLAALFVVLVATTKFVGVVPTLVGIGGTTVMVYLGHTVRIQPKDPSKDLMTLTRCARDVLVEWLRKPAP